MKKYSKNNLSITLIHNTLWIYFIIALAFAGRWVMRGDGSIHLFAIEVSELKSIFALKIDIISALMFLMITLLGALISKYSLSYLNGEKRQVYFYKYLFLTIISASLLVLSNNLIIFFAMWLLSSFGLHKLLLYYPERKQAVAAAWKKFFVSRLGDIALLIAIILTYRTFGTFDFSQLFIAANGIANHSPEAYKLSIIGTLFALGAISKSVQFPFHFWLPETMETPAPVSALMHAGIINAGGFLIIRLSPMLQQAETAHLVLTFFGSITAVFGALVMITQNDIKKKLAFSTISQMGVMMVSCGLGAYSLALFHIIAHSFYKAHAFLSIGFLVEESKKVKFNHSKPTISILILGALVGYLLITLGTVYFEKQYIAYFAYTAILMLGFVQSFDFGKQSFGKIGINFFVILFFILIFSLGICFIFESFLHEKLAAFTPMTWGENGNSSLQVVACYISYTIFVIGLGLSELLIESKNVFTHKLYLYFWNGGYFAQRTSSIFNQSTSKEGAN
jgi:NAD(P)H-quinone oxidoreductase subunit 5